MNPQEPLGLPRGSVRAILTLLLALPVPIMVLASLFGYAPPSEMLAFYAAIVLVVVKDYFGTRQQQNLESLVADEPSSITYNE